jgi:hypothetical protein
MTFLGKNNFFTRSFAGKAAAGYKRQVPTASSLPDIQPSTNARAWRAIFRFSSVFLP